MLTEGDGERVGIKDWSDIRHFQRLQLEDGGYSVNNTHSEYCRPILYFKMYWSVIFWSCKFSSSTGQTRSISHIYRIN